MRARAPAVSRLLTLFLASVILMGLIPNLNVAKAVQIGRDGARYDAPIYFSSDNMNETYLTGFSGLQGVAIGDFNNDGLNEVAVSEGPAGSVTVCESNGTILKQFTGLDNPSGVAIGDINNDGLNEIAIAEPNSSTVIVCKIDGTIVKQFTGLNSPTGVAIGDFDNNGLNEIAIADSGSNKVYVIRSDGTTVAHEWDNLGQPMGVAIGDYDNNGLNEIAITETYPVGNVTVYKSDGTTIVGNWTGRDNPACVAIGDLNNDGKNQLVFTEVTRLTIEPVSMTQALTYNVTFTEMGLPTGTEWWVNLAGNNQTSTSNVISFFLPNGTYTYSSGAFDYTASPPTGQVTVDGANVNEQVTFTIIFEFPSLFILSVFMTAILLAATIIRKRKISARASYRGRERIALSQDGQGNLTP